MNSHAQKLSKIRSESPDAVTAFREAVDYVASIPGDAKTTELMNIMLYEFKTQLENNTVQNLPYALEQREDVSKLNVPSESEVSVPQDVEQEMQQDEDQEEDVARSNSDSSEEVARLRASN